MRIEEDATANASARLSCVTAIRMKGRLTDMLPFKPGNLIFSLEVKAATRSRLRNSQECQPCIVNRL
jgi:hypothetical protein